MRVKAVRRAGFTLVEIMIVVGLVGLLAAIAIPNFVRARAGSQANVCLNNLRQIQSGIQQWAMENRKGARSVVTEGDVLPYLKRVPVCPAGGTIFADSYALTDVSNDPECLLSPKTHALQ